MPAPYTHKKLTDVKDIAPDFGLGDFQAVRFASSDLETEDTGLAHQHIKPGKRPPLAHKHENAEEVYVVIAGSGRLKVDDDILDVEQLDAIRVAPSAMRAWQAGPDGLDVLAFGPRHEGDGEILKGEEATAWWGD